jgi:glycerophosphoryl diester phosphodiesterase
MNAEPPQRAGSTSVIVRQLLVIAHRGASAELPENTLPAFERAIELGADYVELDVHADAAGRLVVTHDRPRPGREYPSLEQALDLMRGRIGAMVELKTPNRYRRYDIVARTVRLLSEDDVLVCFQRPALEQARALRRGLRTVQHVGYGVSIRGARAAWAVGFADGRVTLRGLAAACRFGLASLVYTVNDAERMHALAAAGVAGVFTDRPEVALRLFREPARP